MQCAPGVGRVECKTWVGSRMEPVQVTRTANILGLDNGGGLSRDMDVLLAAPKDLGWITTIDGGPKRGAKQPPLVQKFGQVRERRPRSSLPRELRARPSTSICISRKSMGHTFSWREETSSSRTSSGSARGASTVYRGLTKFGPARAASATFKTWQERHPRAAR